MTDPDSGPSLATAPSPVTPTPATPIPVTPTPFGKPWSIWFWGNMTSAAGAALALAPFHTAQAFRSPLDPSAEPWARMFGIMLIAYSLAYHVAGWTGQRTYMRASVALRCASPVVIGALVMTGNLPRPWILMGLIDLAGAGWTSAELAWRPKTKAA